MKLLAIDSTEETCSVALHRDGDVRELYEVVPRRHSERMLPMVEEILGAADLALADLDALAFARGPGAFTGLRIAAGVVQGLALAADLPVVPVSSLQALAAGYASTDGRRPLVLAALDARMQEVYWGLFRADESGLMQMALDERVAAPGTVAGLPDGPVFGVGSGWGTYAAELTACVPHLLGSDPAARVHAAAVARIAAQALAEHRAGDLADAVPVYLRDEVAQKPSR